MIRIGLVSVSILDVAMRSRSGCYRELERIEKEVRLIYGSIDLVKETLPRCVCQVDVNKTQHYYSEFSERIDGINGFDYGILIGS